jgi:hypothetical protein
MQEQASLTQFLSALFGEGKVVVAPRVEDFSAEDIRNSAGLLKEMYNRELINVPGPAPFFDETGAVWAAIHLYRAIQVSILRHIDGEKVKGLLEDYKGIVTKETIFSADLTLRYLPQLFLLARQLAPGDVLVECLKHTATCWPLSSVGMDIEPHADLSIITADHCLNTIYIDRVILHGDVKRSGIKEVKDSVRQALGGHAQTLWPAFDKME